MFHELRSIRRYALIFNNLIFTIYLHTNRQFKQKKISPSISKNYRNPPKPENFHGRPRHCILCDKMHPKQDSPSCSFGKPNIYTHTYIYMNPLVAEIHTESTLLEFGAVLFLQSARGCCAVQTSCSCWSHMPQLSNRIWLFRWSRDACSYRIRRFNSVFSIYRSSELCRLIVAFFSHRCTFSNRVRLVFLMFWLVSGGVCMCF